MDDPLVRRARRANREVVDFLRWSMLPIATVERVGVPRAGQLRRRALRPARAQCPLRADRRTASAVPLANARRGRDRPTDGVTRLASDQGRPRLRHRRRAARAARRAAVRAARRPARPAAADGGIEATLPDGSRRRVGFHAPGPERWSTSTAGGRWSGWRPRARSAGTRRGRRANGPRPTRCPCSNCSCANARQPAATPPAPRARRAGSTPPPHRLRDNAPRQARDNIAAHYDLGNDFYAAWLDASMTYSSARFAAPDDDARSRRSSARSTLLLDRLDLKPGDRLLEIGCGWGTLAIEAAQRGVQVVGLTLSTEQKTWADASDRRSRPGRPDRDPPAGLSRDRRAIRRHRLGRNGRGGRPALLARLSRLPRAQPEARRQGGAAVHQHRSPPVRRLRRATPTSSRPISSPAGC